MSQFTCVCACICLCSIIHLGVSGFCDFETSGLCNWTSSQSNQNQSHWLKTTAKFKSGGGPLTDHTYNNESGHFLYLSGNETSNGIFAMLKSETLNQPHTCLTFWYYMDGSKAISLRLFLVDGSSTLRELWNMSGNQDNLWKLQAIDVNIDRHFTFVFKGETVDQGYVALDDISITGSCLDCDFEHESCNWDYKKTKWKIMTNTREDPEYSYRGGYFLTLDSSECIDRHTLLSKLSIQPCRATLQFYFFLSGKNDTYINVYLQDNSKKTYIFENVGNSSSRIWKPVKTFITEAVGSHLFFEASRGKNCSGRVAVDDITLTYESCLNSDTSTGTQSTTVARTSIGTRDSKENQLSFAAIIGSVVGSLVLVVVLAIVALWICRKKQCSNKRNEGNTILQLPSYETLQHGGNTGDYLHVVYNSNAIAQQNSNVPFPHDIISNNGNEYDYVS